MRQRSINALTARAQVYHFLGEADKANADLRQAAKIDPANKDVTLMIERFASPAFEFELSSRYEYLRSVYDRSAAGFNRQLAIFQEATKTQADKSVVCRSMAEFNAAFQIEKADLNKLLFIRAHPETGHFPEVIEWLPQAVDFNQRAQTNLTKDAADRGCLLPMP